MVQCANSTRVTKFIMYLKLLWYLFVSIRANIRLNNKKVNYTGIYDFEKLRLANFLVKAR